MVAQPVIADLNFMGVFATRNRRDDPVSSDPTGLGSGDAGRVWFNSTSNKWKYWNGTAAIDVVARGNHTGTQTASTISDLATTVQAYSLSTFAAPTGDLSIGTHKLTSVTDPTSAQDAATKNYVDTALSGLTSGQVIKGAVVCAPSTNISLSSPGGTIDGVTMSNPMTILLTGQTTGSQNGPYVWTGASTALTRALNWNSSGQAVLGSYWVVEQGAHADSYALMTNDTALTLGTDTPAFAFIAGGTTYTGTPPIVVSGGAVSLNIGTGLTTSGGNLVPDFAVVGRKVTGIVPTSTSGIVTVASAVITINHSLGNYAPLVSLSAYTSPYSGYSTGDIPLTGATATDANNVQITLPAAPASNNWAYSVIG